MIFLTNFLLKFKINKYSAFVWNSSKKTFNHIVNTNKIDINLIVGVERQKQILLNNTKNFTLGNFTNNALLWGSRGNGKSSLVRSIFYFLSKNHSNLKLIQLNKNNIFDIEKIYPLVGKFPDLRFIIFIDDLSFEKIDSEYKIIKSTLDGSIQNQPRNIVIYVTSNRRHLMPRDMIDNERSSAIHTDESVEEKISLSDRFGLWIGFHNFNQLEYLEIIKTYCEYFKIIYDKKIEQESVKWSLQRGNRTGRTAWQFIIQIAADRNLKIDF
jgi:predicted AAA+ superfamily ATPase